MDDHIRAGTDRRDTVRKGTLNSHPPLVPSTKRRLTT